MAFPTNFTQVTRPNLFAPRELPTHEQINIRLQQAVLAPAFSALPSVDLLKYAAGLFNLYSAPTSGFQPSIAVRVKLLELAGATRENASRMLNFNNLNPVDLACIFRILNSYNNYEVGTNPYGAIFPSIVPSLQQYLIYLCIDGRGVEVFETLRSYDDPALAVVVQQMTTSLGSRARPQEHFTGMESPYQTESDQATVDQQRGHEYHQEPLVNEEDLVHELLAGNDRLRDENDGLGRRLEGAEEEIFRLREYNDGLLRRLRALEAAQPQLAMQGGSSRPQTAPDIENLQRALLRAEQDRDYNASLNDQVRSDADRDMDRLRQEHAQVISTLSAEKDEAERQKEAAGGDLDRMARDLAQLRARHEELIRREETHRRTAEKVPELERQLQGLQVGAPAQAQGAPKNDTLVKELRDRNQQQAIKIADLEAQIQNLQGQLRTAKAASQTAGQDNIRLRTEIREINERLAKALEEITQLKAK